MKRIGVLALQGDFAAHGAMLDRICAEPGSGWTGCEVRLVSQLTGLDALVLPGGESTTLLKLMRFEPWFDALHGFHARGGALFGTCAGAILLAKKVTDPVQESLQLIDVEIERNGFGRQLDSFETEIEIAGWSRSLPVAFIRAPRIKQVGEGVEVLARLNGEPVLVRQGRVTACTFHSELTADDRLHRWFLEQATRESATTKKKKTSGTLTAAGRIG